MLQFKRTQPLVPLSMKNMQDQASKLPPAEIDQIAKLFMPPGCYSRFTIPYTGGKNAYRYDLLHPGIQNK